MKITLENNVKCILLPPNLDTQTSMSIEPEILKFSGDETTKVLCDFSKTEYISSFGLRIILSLSKKINKSGGQIVLSSMSPSVYEVFKISGFAKIFKILDNKSLAIKELS